MTVESIIAAEGEVVEVVNNTRKEEEEPELPYYLVEGPALPEDFKVDEKKLKKVIKEGGKRGVEIEGAAAMGGLKAFCTVMDEPEGDIVLLTESMKAMNAKSDPTEEERKGGAGNLIKMLQSCTDNELAIVTYVPSCYEEQCNAKEWLTYTVELITDKKLKTVEFSSAGDVSEKNYFRCVIKTDGDNNIFPIKMRDPAVTNAYTYLKKRDLFPDGDDDDDDEYVFGDEDFPS